ncbi:hypothetical protein HZR84_07460 [Hyphobacterium sp. CCMP332]|nr:hypothetical protein HZR84_07460 [Hyphobacterium sp. CCMP332]
MSFFSKWILVILMPFLACKSVQSQKNPLSQRQYINFDSLRPTFPAFHLDSIMVREDHLKKDSVFLENSDFFMSNNRFSDSLLVLMDTLSKLNKSVPYYGYRIVLYNGSDRKKAIFERGKALKILDDKTEVYMNYQRPYFKVKVGNYYDRITAYSTYLKLKAAIPTALLVPEVIDLDKIQFH